MSFMTWSDAYNLDLPKVDQQHRYLFGLVNQLYDAVSSGAEQYTLRDTLDELVNYTVYHFDTEEDLFCKYQYPEIDAHKKEHNDLTQQVLELQGKFNAKEIAISFDVLEFLRDWLKEHTTTSDLKFVEYHKSIKK